MESSCSLLALLRLLLAVNFPPNFGEFSGTSRSTGSPGAKVDEHAFWVSIKLT